MARTGRIEAEGSFFVECDTNIPSGESLIRQIVRGKRWFQENMGADTRVGWLPDTFGFSAALPQILSGCGVKYFATQKLLRQDPECQLFPYQDFWWEGLDGTRVLSHMFFNYGGDLAPHTLHRRWFQDRVQQRDIGGMLCPFGYGDGGGGATRAVLEQQRRANDLEGVPRTRYTRLLSFFETMPEPKKPLGRRAVSRLAPRRLHRAARNQAAGAATGICTERFGKSAGIAPLEGQNSGSSAAAAGVGRASHVAVPRCDRRRWDRACASGCKRGAAGKR